MSQQRNGGRHYTEEFLEEQSHAVLAHQRKYMKKALKHLYLHCIHPELGTFTPEQIKFMTRKMFEIVFNYEQEALSVFNDLPKEEQINLTKDYIQNLEYKYTSQHCQGNRTMTSESIEEFYKKQAQLDIEIRNKALEYLNENCD